jgi:hypothetical protein
MSGIEAGQEEYMDLALSAEQCFERTDELKLSLQSDNVLVCPKRFNHGTYDAAVVMYKRTESLVLVTLQATVSYSHSFKQEYVADLLKQIEGAKDNSKEKISVWHIFVLESQKQFDNFTCPSCMNVGKLKTRNTPSVEVETLFWKALLPVKR